LLFVIDSQNVFSYLWPGWRSAENVLGGKTEGPHKNRFELKGGVRMRKEMCMSRPWFVVALAMVLLVPSLSSAQESAVPLKKLVEGFKVTTVASVSDAVDQVTGQRGFMVHDMRPLFKAKVVGPAVTALIRPSIKASGPASGPNHSLLAIDEAEAGSVVVIVVEEGLDISGIGGLMSTGCQARGLAGAVVDGAARDVDEIISLGFPVFCRSITPSTSVGRYVSVGRNMPVMCAGVSVNPGDIIVAGTDGVVVVPRDKAAEILDIARKIDEREARLFPLIKELKSITKAVEKFKRL
jgi:regulator of RNase E activity RraA